MTQELTLSVDPGKQGCGAALWRADRLLRATYVKRRTMLGVEGPEGCTAMAIDVLNWASVYGQLDRLVLEWPQTYSGRSSRGDTDDLLPLAGVDAAIVTLFHHVRRLVANWEAGRVHFFKPHDWKGSIQKPKKVSDDYPVVGMCERRLKDDERCNIDLPNNVRHQWDVFDAVGVGLKHFNRFERHRVFSQE